MAPGFDVYARAGSRFVVYLRAGMLLAGHHERLGLAASEMFYVHSDDTPLVHDYLLENLRTALASKETPMSRGQVLLDAGGGALRSVLEDPENEFLMETACDIALLAMEQAIEDARVLSALIALDQGGAKEYQHAVQSCVLSAALGSRSGMEMTELSLLAIAGLLHDVGMTRLDAGLSRRRPETYNSVERTMYKRHPLLGAEIVARGHQRRQAANVV